MVGYSLHSSDGLFLGGFMEEKEFKRKVAIEKQAREKMLNDKLAYDRKMHSEGKTWEADYKMGKLNFKEE